MAATLKGSSCRAAESATTASMRIHHVATGLLSVLRRRGGFTATGAWLTPRAAFAEARGLVSLIKDSAAVSPIVTHKLRNNISVLEGSGGNVAVLTGSDGKVLVDAGIGVSRPQMTKALADLGADPVTHLINTHWHFDHTDGNAWLNSVRTRSLRMKTLSGFSRTSSASRTGTTILFSRRRTDSRAKCFASERAVSLNGQSINLKHYSPAHTDSDISVTFAEADVVHVADTFWNGVYSVYRLFDGRQHRRHDRRVGRQSCGDDR